MLHIMPGEDQQGTKGYVLRGHYRDCFAGSMPSLAMGRNEGFRAKKGDMVSFLTMLSVSHTMAEV